MNAVMLSICPRRCELITSGKETIVVRKTKPKIETPFKVYSYCTQYRPIDYINYGYGLNMPAGTVIGKFICDRIDVITIVTSITTDYVQVNGKLTHTITKDTCLSFDELQKYADGKHVYGWHISNLKIYDKPKELNEFITVDKEAIRGCEHRFQSYYRFTEGGYIKNGFVCDKDDTWCFNCKRKLIVRPPQSWCYVGEVNEVYD